MIDPEAQIDLDLQIDELIARHIMGDLPEIRWAASQDGGKSIALWTDNLITKQVVEEFCVKYPQYAVVRRDIWPRYSGNMLAAWRVVEKMRAAGWSFSLAWSVKTDHSHPGIITDVMVAFCGSDAPVKGCATDAEAPRAICLAALRAMRIEIPSISG